MPIMMLVVKLEQLGAMWSCQLLRWAIWKRLERSGHVLLGFGRIQLQARASNVGQQFRLLAASSSRAGQLHVPVPKQASSNLAAVTACDWR